MKRRLMILSAIALVSTGLVWGQPDPPSRVARLNYLNGNVSFRPDNIEEWAPATLNYPLTLGDHIWSDDNSGVEMHIGATSLRLAGNTAFSLLNLDDRTVQISLTEGFLNVRLRDLGEGEVFEVDTPSGAVNLLRDGEYRIDVSSQNGSTAVTVRGGDAEVSATGQVFPVHAGQMGRYFGVDNVTSEILNAPQADQWDRWCMTRNDEEERAFAANDRYVPREMIGSADLATHGVWTEEPTYGAVWYPRSVPPGWAPYRYGHWAYVEPWGWTWIDDASWGFAPFHYGRWAMVSGRWGWVPGARVARPVYAPALVAWVGGSGLSMSVRVGGGGPIGWIPLGPREVYRPAYHVSDVYVRNVNRMPVTNINVTNVTYVNRTYVTAVPRDAFVGARPVYRSAVVVSPSAMNHITVVNRVDVRPERAAYVGRAVDPGMRVAAPPTRIVTREVVARTPPPARMGSERPRIEQRVRVVEAPRERPVDRGQRPGGPTYQSRPVDRPSVYNNRPADRPADRQMDGRPREARPERQAEPVVRDTPMQRTRPQQQQQPQQVRPQPRQEQRQEVRQERRTERTQQSEQKHEERRAPARHEERKAEEKKQ